MSFNKCVISFVALRYAIIFLLSVLSVSCATLHTNQWILVDNFEKEDSLSTWEIADVQNDTEPFVKNPQVAKIITNDNTGNRYYLKMPAPKGIVGNRKALSFKALPVAVETGETYTFYTRINVVSFPNNHSFGLSNLDANNIKLQNYNAFEPMLRITDKRESNGDKNSGALGVIGEHINNKAVYHDIINPFTSNNAKPLETNTWYQIWYVVNNAKKELGGQSYDIYVQGGEFTEQQAVYQNAKFRMARELALTHFITISNTGPIGKPYGNGGLMYDDIYMTRGKVLSTPK